MGSGTWWKIPNPRILSISKFQSSTGGRLMVHGVEQHHSYHIRRHRLTPPLSEGSSHHGMGASQENVRAMGRLPDIPMRTTRKILCVLWAYAHDWYGVGGKHPSAGKIQTPAHDTNGSCTTNPNWVQWDLLSDLHKQNAGKVAGADSSEARACYNPFPSRWYLHARDPPGCGAS